MEEHGSVIYCKRNQILLSLDGRSSEEVVSNPNIHSEDVKKR